MRTKGVLIASAGLLAIAGCVSVEEPTISQGTIRQGQRAVLIVYPSPGPWVTSDQDTKVETGLKFVPGLGQVVQGAQDSRDLKTSKALEQYIPHYHPDEQFYKLLRAEIGRINFPGVWISSGAESETTQDVLDRFNRAADTLEWRTSYYTAEPEEIRTKRNYSTLLSLDDALVLEVNLQHGLLVLDDGNYIPSMSAMSRLYRAGTMKLLWYHETAVDDRSLPKAIEEFMTTPKLFTDSYEKLMGTLAAKLANDLRTASAAPPPAPVGAAASTSTVRSSGLQTSTAASLPPSTTQQAPASTPKQP